MHESVNFLREQVQNLEQQNKILRKELTQNQLKAVTKEKESENIVIETRELAIENQILRENIEKLKRKINESKWSMEFKLFLGIWMFL